MTGPQIILILKIAVIAVTVLLIASLVALARGQYRLHGWLNLVFMVLTLTAVLGLEVVIRLIEPTMFDYLKSGPERTAFRVHLLFSVPSALMLPVMYLTGRNGRRGVHFALSMLFSLLWTGTFVTGVFFLPHTAP